MLFKMKFSIALLLLSVLFISATLALTSHRQDPKLETCMHQCKQQKQYSEQEKQECEQECKKYAKEKERGQGGGSGNAGHCQCEQQVQERRNPYHFRADKFRSKIQSEQGRFGVLPRFSKSSNLLGGIDDYRFAFSEMNPQTFSVPQHWDADTICFVVQGKGAITIIVENNKKTHNLESGDIIRVRAGSTVYVVNKDNNQKLRVVKLIQPVFNPGKFKSFFSAGGRNPESFFNAFSDDVLRAAFNTQSQKIQKLFQSQTRGPILKASREQIQALSRSSSSHELPWPLPKGHSQESFNLFNKRPTHSNDYGAYYEVDQDDYKQLRELDVAVGYANITRGAMLGPYYNSRATSIAVVVDGNGYIEMACPHISSRQGKQGGQGEEEQEEEGSQWGSHGGPQGGRQGQQGGSEEEEEGSQWGSGARRGSKGSGHGGRQGQQGGSEEEEEGSQGGRHGQQGGSEEEEEGSQGGRHGQQGGSQGSCQGGRQGQQGGSEEEEEGSQWGRRGRKGSRQGGRHGQQGGSEEEEDGQQGGSEEEEEGSQGGSQGSRQGGRQGQQGGSEKEESSKGGRRGSQGSRQGGCQGQQGGSEEEEGSQWGRQGGRSGSQGSRYGGRPGQQGGSVEEEEGSQWGSQGGRRPHRGSQGCSCQGGRQGQQDGSEEEEENSQGGSGSSSRYYKKVSARLRKGDLFVIPAGHPVVTVASQSQDLQVMCFQINAQNNKKNPLAGKNNILRQLDREAKELSFNMPARQVDEVLEKQDKSWFFPGPQQSQQQERGGGSYIM